MNAGSFSLPAPAVEAAFGPSPARGDGSVTTARAPVAPVAPEALADPDAAGAPVGADAPDDALAEDVGADAGAAAGAAGGAALVAAGADCVRTGAAGAGGALAC